MRSSPTSISGTVKGEGKRFLHGDLILKRFYCPLNLCAISVYNNLWHRIRRQTTVFCQHSNTGRRSHTKFFWCCGSTSALEQFAVWYKTTSGCECPKGLFSRSPCKLIGLSMAIPRRVYGSSHRSPTSRLDKDCGLLHLTIYSFLLSDCLLLDVAPSWSPALAHGTTYRSTSPQHHLCSPSENNLNCTSSTFISWPSLIN